MSTEQSLLMYDSSKYYNGTEAMLDYVLSWTLRRAQSRFSKDKPILYGYCREILFRLLGIDSYENVEVVEVQTVKQWNYIDLCADVVIKDSNGTEERHAILIEDKVNTNTRKNQLADYKRMFEEYYKDKPQYKRHFVLISCAEEEKLCQYLMHDCEANGYRFFPIMELFDYRTNSDCESDIFNEFWLRTW